MTGAIAVFLPDPPLRDTVEHAAALGDKAQRPGPAQPEAGALPPGAVRAVQQGAAVAAHVTAPAARRIC
jgi:hypothetical protein